MNRRTKRNIWRYVGQPAMRMAVMTIGAVGWFILSIWIFLVTLPQFPYYETLVKNQGTTDAAVWYIWAWIPVILMIVVGIFWSSGMFGRIWDVIREI